MTLSSKDYTQLLELIDIAYSHLDRKGMFEDVCKRLEELIGLSSAAFIPVDPETGCFVFSGHLAFRTTHKSILLFGIYYAPIHPVVTKELHLKSLAEPVMVRDIVSSSRLAEVVYGDDIELETPPFYEFCSSLNSGGKLIGVLGFSRRGREIELSKREREIVTLFLPHLSRALHNIDLMETLNSSLEIGVIFVGEDGKPFCINETAKKALGGRPVEEIIKPDSCSSFFNSESGGYRVRAVATHPGGKERVVLLEPVRDIFDARSRLEELGLSRQQVEVACLAICGLCNKEVAERLYITEQTVKDHLRGIFKKIHVRSRSELTAKVMGLSP